MIITTGLSVFLEYEGKFENGEVFDSSKNHGKPLEFVVGQKQVIPGFENALIGMDKGEEKEAISALFGVSCLRVSEPRIAMAHPS
jgi:FKBP-type peptidyl-prolyl cis-trans isomerase